MSACTIERIGDGRVRLRGQLDVESVPALSEQVRQLAAGGGELDVDLGGITHADSAGVALLVEWYRQARQHGQNLRFVNLPAQMQAIIRVSSLEQVLPIPA